MKHISIRLPWHDRGWDGCVCDSPSKNSYCKGFHSVNAERIRKDKVDKKEESVAGERLNESWEYYPPCSETINVFGTATVKHTHFPKSFIKHTSPKTINIPANASGTWPFEGMWDESGQRFEQDEREENVADFFNEFNEGGQAGLIFYYCNYDNPVSGDDKKYLLAGIARIKKVHPFNHWDDIPKDQADMYGSYIWSRQVENDPKHRIRLPYQEYLKMGKDVRSIGVFAEGDLSRSFKYVAHHITDDDAISLIDKTVASVKKIIQQKFLPPDQIVTWEKNLEWLNDIRKECWISRGLYPGLASVLRFLGMEKPEEFIRMRLKNYPVTAIKDFFFDRFEGYEKMSREEKELLTKPKERFEAMLNSGNAIEEVKAKLCRDKLPYFDLYEGTGKKDEKQISNILGEKRGMVSIISSLQAIYDNPYIISEEYIGKTANDYVNFEKIDHGMIPSDDLGDVEKIDLDDPRRLRCLIHSILRDAALEGHTFLEWTDLVEKVSIWHDQNDKGGMFNFDFTTWNQHKHIFSDKVVDDTADGITAIYNKRLNSAERTLRNEFLALIKDEGIDQSNLDWKAILEKNKTEPIEEQIVGLEKLYRSRLGVLTGTAGTGKTTVIRSLVQGIKKVTPKHDFLLLAPTGKAALILTDRINDQTIKATTIHTFLMKNDWINKSNFTIKQSGGRIVAGTVIIDECSMIETMLFATVLKALKMGEIDRLILVGDYNQLPPIGPGKVFFDLIKYLKKEDARANKCLVELHFNWRQKEGSKASVLASHFAKVSEVPDEDIFKEIELNEFDINNVKNKSDLVFDFWENEEDLRKKIPEVIEFAVKKLLDKSQPGKSLGDLYNFVHKIQDYDQKNIEAINVIVPYRHTPSGVDNINLLIQETLRGKNNIDSNHRFGYVWFDKVLQTRNYTYFAYNHTSKEKEKNEEYYVPNGTLGYVFPKWNKNLHVKFPKNYNQYSFYIQKKKANEMLDLGYATTVHKAQGSQFDITILIIPKEDVDFVNREMLYTALSRSTKFQIVLIQNDISILKSRLWLGKSEISKRNSSLFTTSKGIPAKLFEKYKPESLICEVLPDLIVRSESERIISEELINQGIEFYYEKPLISVDEKSFKLPDFTFKFRRKTYYWEHFGMLNDFDYEKKVEKKKKWYSDNGYQNNLIETPIDGLGLRDSIKFVFEKILNV